MDEVLIENALNGKTVDKVGTDSTEHGTVQIFIKFTDGTMLQLESYLVHGEAIMSYEIYKEDVDKPSVM
jgi:hypothetical protein